MAKRAARQVFRGGVTVVRTARFLRQLCHSLTSCTICRAQLLERWLERYDTERFERLGAVDLFSTAPSHLEPANVSMFDMILPTFMWHLPSASVPTR